MKRKSGLRFQSRLFSVLLIASLILQAAGFTVPARAEGPAILYAKPESSGVNDCSAWADACTLQDALTAAISGDEIWVAAGTYKPSVGSDPGNLRTNTF